MDIAGVGNLSADQRCVFQLKLILIIRSELLGLVRIALWRVNLDELDAGHVAVSIQGIRPSVALAVDDIHPSAVGAEGYIGGIVCGRQKSNRSERVWTTQRNYSDGVRTGVDRVQSVRSAINRDGRGGC